jgi:hypothetical protein
MFPHLIHRIRKLGQGKPCAMNVDEVYSHNKFNGHQLVFAAIEWPLQVWILNNQTDDMNGGGDGFADTWCDGVLLIQEGFHFDICGFHNL